MRIFGTQVFFRNFKRGNFARNIFVDKGVHSESSITSLRPACGWEARSRYRVIAERQKTHSPPIISHISHCASQFTSPERRRREFKMWRPESSSQRAIRSPRFSLSLRWYSSEESNENRVLCNLSSCSGCD